MRRLKIKMIASLLYTLLRNILERIEPDEVAAFIDKAVLGPIEAYVKSTENQWDDLALLPIGLIRKVLSVPDDSTPQ